MSIMCLNEILAAADEHAADFTYRIKTEIRTAVEITYRIKIEIKGVV